MCSMQETISSKYNRQIRPIREKRKYYEERPELVNQILIEGTNKAKQIAKETMEEVKEAMKLEYFRK